MRPTTDPAPAPAPDVIVVGAGLAGLAAAATAARAGRRVTVLDPHAPGGRARAEDRGGYTFNRGPRALYVSGPGGRVLADLGVATPGAAPALRGATVSVGDELHLLPRSPASVARTRLLGPADKARFGARMAALARLDPARFAGLGADAALAELGLGPVGTDLARALVRLSTYAVATDVLDGPAAVAQLQLAARGVRYLDGGFQAIVDGLLARARAGGVTFVEAAAASVSGAGTGDGDGGGCTVTAAGGATWSAPAVVVAAGGPDAAAALLGERPGAWATLGPPAHAACLELGLRRPPPVRFVLGVDEPLYLSTHAPPARLAPPGGAVVHVMRYRRADDDLPATDVRAQLEAHARRAGIAAGDVVEQRFLSRMVVTGGIPTAAGGGLAGRPATDVPGRPGVLVAGDWVGPEGLIADAALASGAAAGRRAAGLAAAPRNAPAAAPVGEAGAEAR